MAGAAEGSEPGVRTSGGQGWRRNVPPAPGGFTMPYDISEEKRDWYRRVSARSRRRKKAARGGELVRGSVTVNVPCLRPEELMPRRRRHGLRALSLFSGGGGLDLGFSNARASITSPVSTFWKSAAPRFGEAVLTGRFFAVRPAT